MRAGLSLRPEGRCGRCYDASSWLDAGAIAKDLGITLAKLRRMARDGQFPEMLHVSRGCYRVPRIDYDAWKQSRMTSAEMAREELQFERDKAKLAGRRP